MKTIIAGSRSFKDNKFNQTYRGYEAEHHYNILCKAVDSLKWDITTVISGTANGADKMGEKWAKNHSVPVEQYPADWSSFGKNAGYIRNKEMSENAEALLALWDGESNGTKHMIDLAKEKGLKVVVVEFEKINNG